MVSYADGPFVSLFNFRYSYFLKTGTKTVLHEQNVGNCSFGKRLLRQFESTSAGVVTGTVLPFHYIQGGAQNVIPLIVHVTHLYYYKSI